MPKITDYFMPKIADYNMAWSGRQTIENTPAIAARLEHMLKDKRFTLVEFNNNLLPESAGLTVMTSRQVEWAVAAKPFVCETGKWETEPHFEYARFAFRYTPTDGYGYWGIETEARDSMKEDTVQVAFAYPHWTFERGGTEARVAHRAPSGALLVTIFAVEEDRDE